MLCCLSTSTMMELDGWILAGCDVSGFEKFTCNVLRLRSCFQIKKHLTGHGSLTPHTSLAHMATHSAVSTETYREKALRKFKQQPLVPVGATSPIHRFVRGHA